MKDDPWVAPRQCCAPNRPGLPYQSRPSSSKGVPTTQQIVIKENTDQPNSVAAPEVRNVYAESRMASAGCEKN
ncbi:hypothetical protein DESC_740077 [Desulfosarcina cetonica]|nr:hypothetical protein DESC_740077 [Desulfosarcina cetonica]